MLASYPIDESEAATRLERTTTGMLGAEDDAGAQDENWNTYHSCELPLVVEVKGCGGGGGGDCGSANAALRSTMKL